jgi:hypothetical protein
LRLLLHLRQLLRRQSLLLLRKSLDFLHAGEFSESVRKL